jgi:hypothetical protein
MCRLSMENDIPRRLKEGRRIPLNVNLTQEVLDALGEICGGNRSAAIEMLVEQHIERTRAQTNAA